MRIEHVLNEVKIVDRDFSEPLKDSDTVRVYHGTSDLDAIIIALTRGLTGGSRANRRFSFEANNNPRGLFVTPDLSAAKDFGSFVIEFQTKVGNLEAPVWPGGTFTVQGQMSSIFDTEDEREQERFRQRAKWSESQFDFVKDSDRPELAALFVIGGERQALFVGDLNANSIRAIWASPDPSRVGQTFKRLSPKEFMTLAKNEEVLTRFGSKRGLDKNSEAAINAKRKVINPRDEVSAEEFIEIVARKNNKDEDQVERLIRKNPEIIKQRVWNDRQFNRIMNDLENS